MDKKKLLSLYLLFLIFIGIAIRLYKFGSIPVSLYWDEVAMLVDAKVLAKTLHDMHGNFIFQTLFPSYGDYKLPVYIWCATLAVKLFGVSEFSLRLPSLLAGLGSIILVGAIAKKLLKADNKSPFDQKLTPLFVMAMMAISPWAIMFSRTGFEGHLGQFILASSFLSMLKGIKNQKYNLLAVVLGAIATYTYFSIRFVWPILFALVWSIYYLEISTKPNFKKIKSKILNKTFLLLPVFIATYFIFLIPMFRGPYYQISNQFRLDASSIFNSRNYALESNQLRQVAGNGIISKIFFHRHLLLVEQLLSNVSQNLSPQFLFLTGDPNLRHGTGAYGLFLLPVLIFWLLGMFSLAKYKPSLFFILVIWWLLGIIPASVPMDVPHALRSLNALVPLVLIIGFGGSYSYYLFTQQNFKKVIQKISDFSYLILLSSVAIFTFSFAYHYFVIYPVESAYDWQDGYEDLANLVLAEHDSVRTVWINPFEDRLYLWMLAYGPYTPEQIQAMESKGFKKVKMDNIEFKSFEWTKHDSLDHRVMVIDYPTNLDEHTVDLHDIASQTIVDDAGGHPRFGVIILDPSINNEN